MHLGGPFDEGAREGRQIRRQDRFGGQVIGVLLAGRDEHGGGRLLGIVEHSHGITEARRHVKIEHRELAGGLGITVRHRHQGRLLQAEDVLDLVLDREGVHQRQFGGAGIAKYNLDAFLLEEFEEGTLSGHRWQDRLRRFYFGNSATNPRGRQKIAVPWAQMKYRTLGCRRARLRSQTWLRVSAAAIAGFTSANPMVDDAAVEFMSITAIVKG